MMKREFLTMAMGFIGCACAAVEPPHLAYQQGDRVHGFVVRAVESLPDIHATLVRMEYEKNGADLVWLARAEENKTFGIAFRTPPADDTGTPHILEHAVLCGSGRYPVKEPFVELLKSSQATFLNAVTWPDLTVYPIATRNARDFSNLIDVYLDAVFDPRCIREPWVLDQEGWHYEVAADGTLSRTGVVHSEMKGSFASPDAVGFHGLKRLVFPDTCYGFVSGGDPARIPDLTFDAFKAFYAKYYHPSNARIFLDGNLDLASVLAQLDVYLSRYDRASVASAIPDQSPVARQRTIPYESAEEENRVILRDGWVFSSAADRESELVFDVLSDYFTGSNEAPLKKALLDAGLCEDVSLYASPYKQMLVTLVIRNTSAEKADACRALALETLAKACRDGLDKERLSAILDKIEFQHLELDTGTTPKGITLMNAAFSLWKHDLDPADAFRFRDVFARVRAKMNDRIFETAIERFILANPHHGALTMIPSKTLAAERAKAEADALAAYKAGLSSDAFAALTEKSRTLKARQSAPDDPAALAKLPRLKVTDVPLVGKETPCQETVVDGVPVLRPEVDVEGLFYLTLAFRIDDLADEDLLDLPFLSTIIGQLATTKRDAAAVKTVMDRTFGDFGLDASGFIRGSWFTVRVAALNRRQAEVLPLVPELLLGTSYDDREAIAKQRVQLRAAMERAVSRNGSTFAMTRATGRLSESGRQNELFSGITQLRRLQADDAQTDFAALAKKVFVRNRLTVLATAGAEEPLVRGLIAAFPSDGDRLAPGRLAEKSASAAPSEGFFIPGNIGFSAWCAQLPCESRRGEHLVASRIVSLDYLWNAVRVKGGAYGASLAISASGKALFQSYRDPNPAGARESFKQAGVALKAFVASGQTIDSYQVAAIGQLEPYRSPKAEADDVLVERLFAERTAEDRARLRREVLTATPEKLNRVADELTAAATNAVSCIIAGEKILDTCHQEKVESL